MTNKTVKDPAIGTIVSHTGWGFEKSENYPCDVYITSGKYLSGGRLSNFWYWRRVLSNGKLAKEECGYGSFEETKDYKIEIKVSCL